MKNIKTISVKTIYDCIEHIMFDVEFDFCIKLLLLNIHFVAIEPFEV